MKVVFADSFSKSLKRLMWHRHPLYKFYELFRYKIPMFLENLWFFRKELWDFRSWDYSFNLQLLRRSLEKTVDTIEYHGHEIDISRLKKVKKMKRVIELINHLREDLYIEMAEKTLGKIVFRDFEFEPAETEGNFKLVDNESEEERAHNKKVFELARNLERDEWNEIFEILKGQNHEEYSKLMESVSDEDKRKKDLWYEWFDGSGMKHWWD